MFILMFYQYIEYLFKIVTFANLSPLPSNYLFIIIFNAHFVFILLLSWYNNYNRFHGRCVHITQEQVDKLSRYYCATCKRRKNAQEKAQTNTNNNNTPNINITNVNTTTTTTTTSTATNILNPQQQTNVNNYTPQPSPSVPASSSGMIAPPPLHTHFPFLCPPHPRHINSPFTHSSPFYSFHCTH